MTFAPQSSLTPFIPIFQEFPVQNVEEMKRVLTKMYTDVSQGVNLRESGAYELTELMTGQRFFTSNNNQTKRFVYRKVIDTGAIAAGVTANIAHGIAPLAYCVNIYGVVQTVTPDWRPVPYIGVAANDYISVRVTAANVVIANGAGAPNIVNGAIILEYLKNN